MCDQTVPRVEEAIDLDVPSSTRLASDRLDQSRGSHSCRCQWSVILRQGTDVGWSRPTLDSLLCVFRFLFCLTTPAHLDQVAKNSPKQLQPVLHAELNNCG